MSELEVNNIKIKGRRLPIVRVNGVSALIDTGSTSTVISETVYKKLAVKDNTKLKVCHCKLITLNGACTPFQ